MVVFPTESVFYYLVFSTNTVTNYLVFLTNPQFRALLFAEGANLVPIEVKAGKTGRLKSLHQFLAEKRQEWGIKISAAPLQYQKPVLSIPFYMVNHWQALWEARERE
ncbi:MAG: hypothetical protein OXI88_21100 [Gammaproteobacteria bacterium]|nr:hypothetical protein [Gammaproteobacteria bacterium]